MRSIMTRQRCLAVCTALLIMPWAMTAAAAVCYVNASAAGANTGVSWAAAYTDLQSALNNVNCTEVWVAQGVYKPAAAGQTTVSFNIGPNVAAYGGFSGSETSRDARDPVTHVTILSGDIDNNDTGVNGVDADTSHIVGGNSRHIVVLDGTTAGNPITATTVLDGFTLTGGDNTNNTNGGGALWCKGNGAGHACSPTLARLVFSGNKAVNGGAMALDGYSGGASNPTLTNVTFSGNGASTFGGAMYDNGQLAGGTSSPVLTNVTFSGNSSANYGGAMVNDGTGGAGATSSPTFTNVTFHANSAVNGGAMFNNGGGGTSSPTLTNVTFNANSASNNGGAMYNTGGSSGTSSPKLINATFSGNSANNGGAIYNVGTNSDSLLLNSIVWGDSATTSGPEFFLQSGVIDLYYSIIQNGCAANNCGGTSNSSGDPVLGLLADNGGFTRTLMPGPSGAAINAVPCSYSSEEPLTDQRGAVRPDSVSTGATRCDIGAVEANSLPGDLIFADRFGSSPWDDF